MAAIVSCRAPRRVVVGRSGRALVSRGRLCRSRSLAASIFAPPGTRTTPGLDARSAISTQIGISSLQICSLDWVSVALLFSGFPCVMRLPLLCWILCVSLTLASTLPRRISSSLKHSTTTTRRTSSTTRLGTATRLTSSTRKATSKVTSTMTTGTGYVPDPMLRR